MLAVFEIIERNARTMFVSTPLLAAEFYIVHDRTTQKRTVVDKPPVTNIRTISLAGDSIYKSWKDANSAMKDIKVCSPQK
ncbi:MAG: hypothetical protein ACM3IH_09770 [Sphingobacteriales bacterium]